MRCGILVVLLIVLVGPGAMADREEDAAWHAEVQLGYILHALQERPDVVNAHWFDDQYTEHQFPDVLLAWTESDLVGPSCRCTDAKCAAGELMRHNAYTLVWIYRQRWAKSASTPPAKERRPLTYRVNWSDMQLWKASAQRHWTEVRRRLDICLDRFNLTMHWGP